MQQALASHAAVELLVPSYLASLQYLLIKYWCTYFTFGLIKYACNMKVFATERILAAEAKALLFFLQVYMQSIMPFLNSLSNTDICWDSIL